jgi:hypothetical protein
VRDNKNTNATIKTHRGISKGVVTRGDYGGLVAVVFGSAESLDAARLGVPRVIGRWSASELAQMLVTKVKQESLGLMSLAHYCASSQKMLRMKLLMSSGLLPLVWY